MTFDSTTHFRLLRLAKLRQIKARKVGERIYAVESYSAKVRGEEREYIVTETACPCDAQSCCTHQALALDRFMFDDADTFTFLEYSAAQREDLAELIQRARADELKRDDKSYVRSCVKSVEVKIPRVERIQESQPCPF